MSKNSRVFIIFLFIITNVALGFTRTPYTVTTSTTQAKNGIMWFKTSSCMIGGTATDVAIQTYHTAPLYHHYGSALSCTVTLNNAKLKESPNSTKQKYRTFNDAKGVIYSTECGDGVVYSKTYSDGDTFIYFWTGNRADNLLVADRNYNSADVFPATERALKSCVYGSCTLINSTVA